MVSFVVNFGAAGDKPQIRSLARFPVLRIVRVRGRPSLVRHAGAVAVRVVAVADARTVGVADAGQTVQRIVGLDLPLNNLDK